MNANSTAERHIPSFARYVGVDYSGAETPRASSRACAFIWPRMTGCRLRSCLRRRPPQPYNGIDYSGAETPRSSLPVAEGDRLPIEVRRRRRLESIGPGAASRSGWSSSWASPRRLWSASTTASPSRSGISRVNHLKQDWPAFLDDFRRHWPTDDDHTYVDFVRDGIAGDGAVRSKTCVALRGIDSSFV